MRDQQQHRDRPLKASISSSKRYLRRVRHVIRVTDALMIKSRLNAFEAI